MLCQVCVSGRPPHQNGGWTRTGGSKVSTSRKLSEGLGGTTGHLNLGGAEMMEGKERMQETS